MHRFRTVAVIEEHSQQGGLAAQAKQIAWEHRAPCNLQTFSLKDAFIHTYGSHADLLRAHGLAAPLILEKIVASISGKEYRHGGNQPHGPLSALASPHRRAG
jgi:transketolase